jgi:hypothetical protein
LNTSSSQQTGQALDLPRWPRPPAMGAASGRWPLETNRRGVQAPVWADVFEKFSARIRGENYPSARQIIAGRRKGRGSAHSTRDSAQVTASGAVTSVIVAVSTRPNRQNRSTCSRMSAPIALMPPPPCEPVHMRCAPMRRTRARGANRRAHGAIWRPRLLAHISGHNRDPKGPRFRAHYA